MGERERAAPREIIERVVTKEVPVEKRVERVVVKEIPVDRIVTVTKEVRGKVLWAAGIVLQDSYC